MESEAKNKNCSGYVCKEVRVQNRDGVPSRVHRLDNPMQMGPDEFSILTCYVTKCCECPQAVHIWASFPIYG